MFVCVRERERERERECETERDRERERERSAARKVGIMEPPADGQLRCVGVNCGKLGRVPSLFIKRRGAARRDQQQNNIALRNVKPGN